jgi:hypothetical protein
MMSYTVEPLITDTAGELFCPLWGGGSAPVLVTIAVANWFG